ncbi:MAG: DUF1788 domain-containing protein [Candidatus Cloacimonadaceae bacterium]|nr:DUF1788 domain-containing protein [Candidatus Cloacimonadaceae bacterium]
MSSSKFVNMTGLANELPYYICPFEVEDTLEMYQRITQLKNQLELKGISVFEINLYRLVIEHLENVGEKDSIIEKESSLSRAERLNTLCSITDAEEFICPIIYEKIKQADFKIIFITGVGEVFPYIRTHNVLTNLQVLYTEKPVVLFFPGNYDTDNEKGSNLTLFGRLDDRYYRAFNIFRCQL